MPDEDGYEYSVPMTFGIAAGAAGAAFRIVSPWNTPCEMAVMGVSYGSAGGGLAISLDGATSVAVGPTTAPNDRGARGLYLYQGQAFFSGVSDVFFPFPLNGAGAFWTPKTPGDACLVAVIFRRALSAFPKLPDAPVVNPEDEHGYHELYQQLRAEEGGK